MLNAIELFCGIAGLISIAFTLQTRVSKIPDKSSPPPEIVRLEEKLIDVSRKIDNQQALLEKIQTESRQASDSKQTESAKEIKVVKDSLAKCQAQADSAVSKIPEIHREIASLQDQLGKIKTTDPKKNQKEKRVNRKSDQIR